MADIKLYYHTASPPARAVLAVLTLLNIPHDLITVDLANKDQFKPEILEVNTAIITTRKHGKKYSSNTLNFSILDEPATHDSDSQG
jgi:hypothetical protein